MNTFTRRKHSPSGQYSIAGKRQDNDYTEAQRGDVAGRRAGGVDRPFPNKPVSHRRPLNARKKDPLELCDFEKIKKTEQKTGPLSLQKHRSNGIGATTGPRHPRTGSEGLPSREIQMTREIHAKELMLQEKLWRVGEKVRQQIKRDVVSLDDDQEGNDHRAARGKPLTHTRVVQVRRQGDVIQISRRKDEKFEDRMSPQSQRRGPKGTHEINVHEQEVRGELNKLRMENRKEHTSRKGEGERDLEIWRDAGVKSQHGSDRSKGRELRTTSTGDEGWARVNEYREMTRKEVHRSEDERETLPTSQKKTSHGAATQNLHDGGPDAGKLGLTGLQLLKCKVCNRKFVSDRIEKHIEICEKVKQSHRQVFNSYGNRTKGSAIEKYWQNHCKPPEVSEKSNPRQNKANAKNMRNGRIPGGTSKTKQSK